MMDVLPTRGDWHNPYPRLKFYFCAFFRECAIVNSAPAVSVASWVGLLLLVRRPGLAPVLVFIR
jgi:hypothetical protein